MERHRGKRPSNTAFLCSPALNAEGLANDQTKASAEVHLRGGRDTWPGEFVSPVSVSFSSSPLSSLLACILRERFPLQGVYLSPEPFNSESSAHLLNEQHC
jgi:hypothetical protein